MSTTQELDQIALDHRHGRITLEEAMDRAAAAGVRGHMRLLENRGVTAATLTHQSFLDATAKLVMAEFVALDEAGRLRQGAFGNTEIAALAYDAAEALWSERLRRLRLRASAHAWFARRPEPT